MVPAICLSLPLLLSVASFVSLFVRITHQSSRASFCTPQHSSSPVLVVPRLSSETTCEGRHGLYPATQAAAATSELLAVFAESVQTLNTNWQLPGRQSQPETPEVTRRRRSAHQTAAQSCGRRHSGEKCYNQNRRARIQSTPQTDVARHSQKIQSAEKVPRSHHFNPQPII